MKVHVLKNRSGKVLATFEPAESSGLKLEPQVPKGHKVEELEVPEDYITQLTVIYQKKATRKKKTA